MSKLVKITKTCPKCKASLLVAFAKNDVGKVKKIECQCCHSKYDVPIPVSFASRFEVDPTVIEKNKGEQSLMIETVPNPLTGYQNFELTSDYYTIGRKNNSGPEKRPDVEVVTTDKKMGRLHAAIRKEGKLGFILKDLDSLNGVKLSGMALEKGDEVYLIDGDRILLGDTEFVVNIVEHTSSIPNP